MAIINNTKREINAKIVYYGQEGAGKGTLLRYLYERIKPTLRGELKTLQTSGGSLLFFDFSPFEQPVFGGYHIRFHIYTLPGRVNNPAAWKMTLKGADGVVLVVDAADSSPAGRQSVESLRDYLASYGMSLHDMPAVLQVNKADRNRSATTAATAALLELEHLPGCLSTALNGEGVLETFSNLSRQIMERISAESSLKSGQAPLPPSSMAAPEYRASTATLDKRLDRVLERDHTSIFPQPGGDVVEPPAESPPSPPAGEAMTIASLPPETETGSDIRVALADEAVALADGSIRIPLTISLQGQARRFLLKVTVEPETETP
ncbi:MAG: GTPase domain-containing protein [Oryzomonas sp.]|uniref:GTP-binding protein n=1 Tax=Oryzomonas sp. TaxID=2855186 RepID=UPI00284C100E|nr:GTPase domain-containing protein [Oryzomonas sp.]MDR3579304.1 GTPase domain-containing protein [Oryzomonas sp.]